MTNEIATTASVETLVRNNPQLNNPATLAGIEALIGKLAPLVQGQRLNNLVDLASALSDVIDMADDAMIQKVMKAYENLAAGAFNLNNAVRYASAQAAAETDPPSLWQSLRRFNKDEDARRGLSMALSLLALLGRDARQSQTTMDAD
ncbi:MAG: hypothetical protein ABIY56_01865 [Dokdonella sp.]